MRPINKIEFLRILAEVERQGCMEERRIKYVNFDYDNRTQSIWRIVFRCWGLKYVFATVNNPENGSLAEKVMNWLEGKSEKTPTE